MIVVMMVLMIMTLDGNDGVSDSHDGQVLVMNVVMVILTLNITNTTLSATFIPQTCCNTSRSKSTYFILNISATMTPTVDFPAPGQPMITRLEQDLNLNISSVVRTRCCFQVTC